MLQRPGYGLCFHVEEGDGDEQKRTVDMGSAGKRHG